jgi:hypothetical protein
MENWKLEVLENPPLLLIQYRQTIVDESSRSKTNNL